MSDHFPGLDRNIAAFTIGYGGRTPDEFGSLLAKNQIQTIVDVRLRPDRSSMGSYVKAREDNKGIVKLLANYQIQYLSLIELGNLFIERANSTGKGKEWKEVYGPFLERAGPLLFDGLVGVKHPICFMCAEKLVCDCHRWHIAAYLEKMLNWKFTHLE